MTTAPSRSTFRRDIPGELIQGAPTPGAADRSSRCLVDQAVRDRGLGGCHAERRAAERTRVDSFTPSPSRRGFELLRRVELVVAGRCAVTALGTELLAPLSQRTGRGQTDDALGNL